MSSLIYFTSAKGDHQSFITVDEDFDTIAVQMMNPDPRPFEVHGGDGARVLIVKQNVTHVRSK